MNALELIAEFEGFRSAPYRCAAGVPTIGYGATRWEDGSRVTMADAPISEGRARELLSRGCEDVDRAVSRLIVVPLAEHQRAALASLAFNIGTGAFAASTLRQRLNRGDFAGAAAEFQRWRFSGGRVLAGLVRRRAAERALFEGIAG